MTNISPISENIPDYIISIVEVVEHHGFSIYLVGGAIRDLLLGRVPIEFDLASDATPDDIMSIFDHVIPIGKAFGTVAVHFNGHVVEITTFRVEGAYSDSRHPDRLSFTSNLNDDLARRDFTINAMAFHLTTQELIDNYNGVAHLNERRLVCVGSPYERFQEDTLRAFRCFRFMSQLGFIVSSDILDALQTLSDDAVLPSIPRIRHEMNRLLLGNFWLSSLKLMHESHWLKRIISEYPVNQTIELPHDVLYRWAWLMSKTDIHKMGVLFQFSKRDIHKMKDIITWGYNSDIVDLSVNDLAMSSSDLIVNGFKDQMLGEIQKKILFEIRSQRLDNTYEAIAKFISEIDV